jgi:CheY-like chemotaxis protein
MTILVLDDDPSVIALIRVMLLPLGHTILEANTAEEAFIRFEENDGGIDLLIADVTLPDRPGTQVALELRSLLPYLRIIMASGYPPTMWNEQEAAELSELPSDSVLTLQKPFAPFQLQQAVMRLLGLCNIRPSPKPAPFS